jgi:hypothetical protein
MLWGPFRQAGRALLLVGACGGSRTPTASPAVAKCLAQVERSTAAAQDAPGVVLYERSPWLMASGTDFPTIAVWPNGDVIFVHENGDKKFDARQGAISKQAAAVLIGNVASSMRGVPSYTSVSNWTDARTVEIVVRDDGEWRLADVYGLTRNARHDEQLPPELRSKGEPAPARKSALGGFVNAYRQLLTARPSDGAAFLPMEIEVLVWGFEYAPGEPLLWPSDLPPPPADIVPKDDASGDPHSYSFMIDAKYADQLRQLLRTADGSDPPRPIGFNGHKWTVNPIGRFRGQAVIESVLRCAQRDE